MNAIHVRTGTRSGRVDRLGALFIILAMLGGVSPTRAAGLPHRHKSAHCKEVTLIARHGAWH